MPLRAVIRMLICDRICENRALPTGNENCVFTINSARGVWSIVCKHLEAIACIVSEIQRLDHRPLRYFRCTRFLENGRYCGCYV